MSTTKVTYSMIDGASVNVKDFGASSSATAAANLAAFKSAVAAVPVGGTLLIPAAASFYLINTSGGLSTAIEINKRMEIVFEGDVKANFSAIQSNPPYIFNVTANDVTFTGGGGKIIGDGAIDDSNTGTDATMPGLIYVSGNNFTMTNCLVETPPKVGVMLYSCSGAKILGNTFTGGPTTYTSGHTAYFAIRTYLGDTHNISDNIFTPNTSGGMYVSAIFMSGTYYCVVDSNVCYHPYEKFIYCAGYKNTVSNNKTIGNPNTIPGTSTKGTLTSVYRFDGDYNLCAGNYSDYCLAGVTCYKSKGNTITSNTFLRNGQLGIVVFEASGYAGSLSKTVITNNTMSFDTGMGYTAGDGAINIQVSQSAASNILVTGNFIDTFTNASGAGIYIEGTTSYKITNLQVSNNHIISSTNGILIKYVEQSKIADNMMSNISNTMIIQLSTCSSNTITNNFSTTAGSTLDSGYSTDSTYAGNQCTSAALQGLFTMSATNSKTITHGGVRSYAKVLLQPANASAATLMGSAKCLYAAVSQPDFYVYTANGVAAAGTEQFWYNIIQ